MKKFTLEEAQEILPDIKNIVEDVIFFAREYMKGLQEATKLLYSFRENIRDEEGILDRVMETRERIKSLVKELNDLGVILKDFGEGIIDFPTEIDGKLAFFCWKRGEEDIEWWHFADEGFEGRKRIRKRGT